MCYTEKTLKSVGFEKIPADCAMRRGIKVAPECISLVKQALRRHGFPSQNSLALDLGLARGTITRFFTSKPVDYLNFVEISEKLGLDWQAIAYIEEEPPIQIESIPDMGRVFARARNHDLTLKLGRAFARVLALALESEIKQALQELKEQLPDPDSDWEISRQWWQANGQAWTEQLKAVMIKHRNIGHEWQFSERHKESLRHYYDANRLLVDCLNSSCNLTPAVRSHIEETLLLPIAEIEKHR